MQQHTHKWLAAAAIAALLGGLATSADAQRRGGGGGGRAATSIQRPAGGELGATRANSGAINSGNRVNTGDINVNVDRNWDSHVHVSQPIYRPYYPVAAGVAIGAAVTAAAIGSTYYALPPACSPYPYAAHTYYYCGNVYYRPQYQGSTVVYVVVDKPG